MNFLWISDSCCSEGLASTNYGLKRRFPELDNGGEEPMDIKIKTMDIPQDILWDINIAKSKKVKENRLFAGFSSNHFQFWFILLDVKMVKHQLMHISMADLTEY